MRSGLLLGSAMALNAVLFAVTLWVGALSGSRAVLSQAVFDIADLIGVLMLTWGYVASRRPPDVKHPFGYGKERFFWAYSASLVTFTLAGVGVLAAGLEQTIDPQPVGRLGEGLLVVGANLLVSLIGVLLVLRELRLERSSVQSFIGSSQISFKTIFYQDVLSAVGSSLAFGGLVALYRAGAAEIDGLTADLVGSMMLVAGIVHAAESRELLVGRALSRSEAGRVLALAERHANVRKVRNIQSMMLGPEDALLALKINFRDGLTTDELETSIDEISAAIRTELPVVRHLVIEPES